jgi:hypothetical protein
MALVRRLRDRNEGIGGGLGFGREFTGAHLGLLGVDLAVAFGCGPSEEVGDVIRKANVKAARS